MEIWEQISRQRVQHIVESYQLYGDTFDDFNDYLEDLLMAYAPPLIELALIEILVQSWLQVPLIKGIAFIEQVHNQLRSWEYGAIAPKITPAQFRQISGLDPTPVFGSYNQPTLHKSTH